MMRICLPLAANRMRRALVAAIAITGMPAMAADGALGDALVAKFGGTVSLGTMIRTQDASPDSLGTQSTARLGLPAGNLGGNAGGGDLNFSKNRPVSTVLKGVFDLDLQGRDLGFFARARAWYDFELKDGDRAYGNYANGFARNTPLSDRGFDPAAKFGNARFADVYVYGKSELGDGMRLDARLGRQVVNWGTAQLITGGINVANPMDFPAQNQPGALPQEARLPVGMAYAKLAGGNAWSAEGLIPYEYRANALLGCGTFLAAMPWAAGGCNFAPVLPAVSEPAALASGTYIHRSADILPPAGGQYGLALAYRAEPLQTEFKAYALNYHSRAPSARVVNVNIAGGYGAAGAAGISARLADANGLRYVLVYPEDIRLYGASFDTKLDAATRLYGELAYRPNQALNLNASDVIAAFVVRNPLSALNLAKGTNALAPGAAFDTFDRFRVTTATFGAGIGLPAALGAERWLAGAELGWSHVAGLPDPGVLRYGRPDDYGQSAIAGQPCVDTTLAQKSCAHDGFVTPNAWGYRLRLAATYPGAFFGAGVTPSLVFAHDVSGYSYDGTFLKDRRILRPGLRADWGKDYFAEVQYTRMFKASYNLLSDRSNVSLVAGVSF